MVGVTFTTDATRAAARVAIGDTRIALAILAATVWLLSMLELLLHGWGEDEVLVAKVAMSKAR